MLSKPFLVFLISFLLLFTITYFSDSIPNTYRDILDYVYLVFSIACLSYIFYGCFLELKEDIKACSETHKNFNVFISFMKFIVSIIILSYFAISIGVLLQLMKDNLGQVKSPKKREILTKPRDGTNDLLMPYNELKELGQIKPNQKQVD